MISRTKRRKERSGGTIWSVSAPRMQFHYWWPCTQCVPVRLYVCVCTPERHHFPLGTHSLPMTRGSLTIIALPHLHGSTAAKGEGLNSWRRRTRITRTTAPSFPSKAAPCIKDDSRRRSAPEPVFCVSTCRQNRSFVTRGRTKPGNSGRRGSRPFKRAGSSAVVEAVPSVPSARMASAPSSSIARSTASTPGYWSSVVWGAWAGKRVVLPGFEAGFSFSDQLFPVRAAVGQMDQCWTCGAVKRGFRCPGDQVNFGGRGVLGGFSAI